MSARSEKISVFQKCDCFAYLSYRVVRVPLDLMVTGLYLLNHTAPRIQTFVISLLIGPALSAGLSRYGGQTF